jgi:hypothetical protein
MKRAKEKGVALILALILVLVLSVMAVSLMFLSQTETWSSMNYRLMTQARYGAESGLHKAAHHLIYAYPPPGGAGDPMTSYNVNVSPVTAGGRPVILSASSNTDSNYPVSSAQSAFHDATYGTLTLGHTAIGYAPSAKLLSMRQVNVYGTAVPATIQTWEITSDGNIAGLRNAQVEVTGVLERQATPTFAYAVFATDSGCGALGWSGGGTTDSYDSGNIQMSGGNVVTQQYGGNAGTNGNLLESGHPTTIYGSLSTPRTGVGTCTTTNVTAWTNNGNAQVTGGLVELPQPIVYPTPDAPNPMPPTTNVNLTKNSGCQGLLTCVRLGNKLTLAPGSYGNLNLTGQADVHFIAGTYIINSIGMQGNSTITIDSGPVIFNMGGQNVATVVDFTGGSVTNASLDPAAFQIMYAGTAAINLSGNAQSSGMVYAPNSTIKFTGGSDWFGAVIGRKVDDAGGTAVHYDRRLQNEFFTVGNWMMHSFTWKKY